MKDQQGGIEREGGKRRKVAILELKMRNKV